MASRVPTVAKYEQFLTTREAGDLVGYTTDYVAKLAREKKVLAKRVGSSWLIDRDSLKLFSLEAEAEKRNRKEALRAERLKERVCLVSEQKSLQIPVVIKNSYQVALAQTAVLSTCLFLFVNLLWFAFEANLNTSHLTNGIQLLGDKFLSAIVEPNLSAMTAATAISSVNDKTIQKLNSEFLIKDESITVLGLNSQTAALGVSVYSPTPQKISSAELGNSFSDQVTVDFMEDGSGVVTPVFKEGLGESYRFELIPLEAE